MENPVAKKKRGSIVDDCWMMCTDFIYDIYIYILWIYLVYVTLLDVDLSSRINKRPKSAKHAKLARIPSMFLLVGG
jgi:hypothetical protein